MYSSPGAIPAFDCPERGSDEAEWRGYGGQKFSSGV